MESIILTAKAEEESRSETGVMMVVMTVTWLMVVASSAVGMAYGAVVVDRASIVVVANKHTLTVSWAVAVATSVMMTVMVMMAAVTVVIARLTCRGCHDTDAKGNREKGNELFHGIKSWGFVFQNHNHIVVFTKSDGIPCSRIQK